MRRPSETPAGHHLRADPHQPRTGERDLRKGHGSAAGKRGRLGDQSVDDDAPYRTIMGGVSLEPAAADASPAAADPASPAGAVNPIDLEVHELADQLLEETVPDPEDHIMVVVGVVDRKDQGGPGLADPDVAVATFLGTEGEQSTALGQFEHIGATLIDPHALIIAHIRPASPGPKSLSVGQR